MPSLPDGFWKFLGNLITSGYGILAAVIVGAVMLVLLIPAPDRYRVIDDFINHPLVLLMVLVFILVVLAMAVYIKRSEITLTKLRKDESPTRRPR
jgi:hypothetical protein